MNRSLAIVLTAALLFGASACGEKKPLQPAAYQGKKILAAVEGLSSTYEKKSLSGFMGLVGKGYAGRETFQQALSRVFSTYDTIRFATHNTKMLVMVPDRGNIRLTVNWDGEWRNDRGDLLRDGGRVTLVVDPNDFLLVAVEGKNPFVPAEKQGKQ